MIENLNEIDKMYKDYKIPKGNGKYRHIQAPCDELKEEQRKILIEDLSSIKINSCAYGFVNGKNIYSNAKEHLEAKTILELDLKNFFDTITYEQVYNALINNKIDKDRAKYIARVCTRNGATPQGAPTSPQLSNIVCKPMDKKIKDLCINYNCKYTRYADDLTFSSSNDDSFNILQKLKPKVQSIINNYGFRINGTKTHTVGKHRRQSVTGIVVNQKLNVSNRDIMKFRAKLHNIIKDIKNNELHTFEELEQKYDSINSLQGYANFIYQANKNKCQQYVDQVKEIRKTLK